MRFSSLRRAHLARSPPSSPARCPASRSRRPSSRSPRSTPCPFEQQWVSRIHKALKAAEARGEIEYKFSRERRQRRLRARDARVREQGNKLIVGEAFAVEAAARKVAKDFPKVVVPDGLLGQAAGAELRGVRQLHPGAGLPDRHGRRRHDQDQQDRHGRRLPDPRSQPADERLHGRREGDQSEGRVHGQLHQLLVRSAQGQGSRLRDDRQGRRRASTPSASACRDAAKEQGQARDRQRDQHAGQVPRHRRRLGALEHGADDRPRDQAR